MTATHPDQMIATQPPPDQQTAYESARYEGQVGRFSRGIEAAPDTPGKLHRGRYSEGMERLPESPRKRHPGRFSDGAERTAESETKLHRGTFADRA
jgi:hypothetical protein